MRERVFTSFNGSPDRVFAAEIQHGGVIEWVNGDMFTVSSQDENESVYSLESDNWAVSLCFTSWTNGAENLSRFTVTTSGEVIVRAVRYPWVVCTAVSAIDNLLFSSAWGDNIQRPTQTIRHASASPSARFAQDYIRYAPDEVIYTYPSIMSMQYAVLHNSSESFYFATYSTAGFTETFHAKVTGKYDMELSVCHYPFAQNESWESPECAAAFLGGGWHEAADLYRLHMGNAFPTPKTPAWVRARFHGWVEFVQKLWHKPLTFTFDELPEIYRDVHEKTGMSCLFVAGWHDDGHDTKFPRYQPHEPAGTAEDLRRALDGVRQAGGKVLLYTNARLVDINEDYYRQGGKDGVALNEQGEAYIETYGTDSVFAVACPGCEAYTQQMASVAGRISGELGADGMFADQISCNLDPFCFSATHSHTKPSNNFLPGVEMELQAINAAYRPNNPDFMLFAEGCHERFGSYYDVHQGHGEEYTWQIGQSLPEQFAYTFPDRIVTGHTADKQQMYHAMAQMKPLDVKPSCFKDETCHEPLRAYIRLREAYPEYFLQGTFIDDAGFEYRQGLRLFAKRGEAGILIGLWTPGAVESTPGGGWFKMPEGYATCKALYPATLTITPDGGGMRAEWVGPLAYIIVGV